MNWLLAVYVAFGGALGSAGRYALGYAIQSRTESVFPVGTLVVNVSGSFLVGVLMRYGMASDVLSAEARLFLTVGLCGGFTTFSTFSYETARLIEVGDFVRAALYATSSFVLSLAGTFAGFVLARALLAARQG